MDNPTTISIALPKALQSFLNQQVDRGNHESIDRYILHLLQQEQAKIARVEELLIEGLESGDSIEATEDWWDAKRIELSRKSSQSL
ncbi:MAG: type II toxin-antitoxin system ParD family antitoxin [Cyanobacteria bacterium P01_E01_bin.42]